MSAAHFPPPALPGFSGSYGPLRHPIRPSLTLTSRRLIQSRPPLGFPVLRLVPVACMPSPLPRQDRGTRSLVVFHRRRPSPRSSWVGSCIARFEACSAFTRVTACMLTESPCDPLRRRLQRLRYLHRRFGCYRVERTSSRAGLTPVVDHYLFNGVPDLPN